MKSSCYTIYPVLFVCSFFSTINAYSIREARPADMPALTAMHHTTWHNTHDSILPSDYCAKQTIERFDRHWKKFFLKNDGSFALVAIDDNQILGFISAGIMRIIPEENLSVTDAYAEVYKLYIDANHQHGGMGKQLIQACFERLGSLGYVTAVVRVFTAGNACHFYEHIGGKLMTKEPIIHWPTLPYTLYYFQL